MFNQLNQILSNHSRPGLEQNDLPPGSHVCWFYRNEQERDTVMAAFLHTGLTNHERCNCFRENSQQEGLKQALARRGLELEPVISSGQLNFLSPEEVLAGGRDIQPNQLINRLTGASLFRKPGPTHPAKIRLAEDMSWTGECAIPEATLIEYEVQLTYYLRRCQSVAMCQYDISRFKGEAIINILQAHPIIVWNGMLVRNPFYLEPVTMLARLSAHA